MGLNLVNEVWQATFGKAEERMCNLSGSHFTVSPRVVAQIYSNSNEQSLLVDQQWTYIMSDE